MSYEQDPPRLSQTRDDELAELLPGLDRARTSGPSSEQLARICAGVAARTTPPQAGGPSGQAAPSTTGSTAGVAGSGSSAAKVATVIAIGTLLGAVAFFGLRNAQERVPADRTTRAVPASAAPAVARPVMDSPARPTPEPPSVQPAVARRPAAGGAGHGARVIPSAEADEPDVNLELALLKRARAEVRPNPARALALTQEHAARFARGTLAEEREVIAIEALLVLGRRAAAEQRAHAFFASYPGSAHTRRVRTMFSEHGAALSDESPGAGPHPSR